MNMPVRTVQEEAAALAGKLKAFLTGGFQLKDHPLFGELSMAQWLQLASQASRSSFPAIRI